MDGAAFVALVTEEDLDRLLDSDSHAVAESALSGRPARREISFRMRRSDGALIEVESLSELVADADGRPLSMISTVRDITEAADAKRALKEKERHLDAAQTVAQFGSFRLAIATGTVEWSKELYELMGRDPEAGPALLPELLPETAEREQLETKLQFLYEPHEPHSKQLATVDFRRHADGAYRNVRAAMEMSYDYRGQADILTGVIRDVTDEIRREADLRAAFLDDGMTDILSKPLARSALEAMLAGLPAPQRDPAQSVLDLDHLADLRAAVGPTFGPLLERFETETDALLIWLEGEPPIDEIRARVHKVAGSAAAFGATRFRAELVAIENAAQDGIRGDTSRIGSLWQDTRAALSCPPDFER